MKNKNIFLSSLGTGLEYYDFTVYALLIHYIAQNFFCFSSQFTSITFAIIVFAIGYIARPFGGVLFGYFGDKYGRKKILVHVMLFMGFSTVLMGILPPVAVGGELMGILFICLRLIQGVSYGAELPCTLTFIAEHSNDKRRGLNCSIMTSFVSIGVLLACGLIFVISTYLSPSSMNIWGWRIPFILGGIIAFISYLIRKNGIETEPFLSEVKNLNTLSNPTKILFKKNFPKILLGTGVLLFPSFLILFFLILPSFLQNFYQVDSSDIYLGTMIAYGSTVITLPIFGAISDKFGRRKSMIIVLIIFIFTSFYFFDLMSFQGFIYMLIFMLIYQLFISALAGNFYPFLTELFPVNIRYSGVAVSYNLAFAIAAFSPMIAELLYNAYGNLFSVTLFFIIIALITLTSCIISKNKTLFH